MASEAGPIFKILEGPSATMEGVSNVVLVGLGSVFSAGSKAADLFPHDIEGLLQVLRIRNRIAEIARKRCHWIGGRLYNLFSGEHPDYIPLSGTHLRQTLDAAGIEPPDFVVAAGKYELRADISREAEMRLADLHAQSTP